MRARHPAVRRLVRFRAQRDRDRGRRQLVACLCGCSRTLREEADAGSNGERVAPAARRFRCSIDARYEGQNFEVVVPIDDGRIRTGSRRSSIASTPSTCANMATTSPERRVEIVNCRLQGVGQLAKPPLAAAAGRGQRSNPRASVGAGRLFRQAPSAGSTRRSTHAAGLAPAPRCADPAIIEEMSSTTVLAPGSHRDRRCGSATSRSSASQRAMQGRVMIRDGNTAPARSDRDGGVQQPAAVDHRGHEQHAGALVVLDQHQGAQGLLGGAVRRAPGGWSRRARRSRCTSARCNGGVDGGARDATRSRRCARATSSSATIPISRSGTPPARHQPDHAGVLSRGELIASPRTSATIPTSAARCRARSPAARARIFEEGIRIPVTRICARRQARWPTSCKLIAANTRDPEERELDLQVQIATNERGAGSAAAARPAPWALHAVQQRDRRRDRLHAAPHRATASPS